ncbi:MAG TPA: hypothetical protein VK083_23400 [Nocardia sp.]|uniref:hypothetical protein n=1 Tax=Nocardia TaxID=1817 RepID=UPI002456C913|nr:MULTISPECIES: hypothetical protein [Nocardia]HLS79741.1 hypothetical protein [Nocardia sp.]
MVDNAVTDQSEPDPGVVIWPEPSKLDDWWERVVFGAGGRPGSAPGDPLRESTRGQ